MLYQLWRDLAAARRLHLVTGVETVVGYLIAVAARRAAGLAIAFSRVLRQTLYPFFVSLEMTPKIAFAPLFISWLGFGSCPR